MTCQYVRSPATTLFEAKETLGDEHGWPHRGYRIEGDRKVPMTKEEQLAEQVAKEKRIVLPESWSFQCGDGPAEPQCRCGAIADLLCDYPVGRGKTCDLPICSECALHIRDEVDLCVVHAIEHRAGNLRRVKL